MLTRYMCIIQVCMIIIPAVDMIAGAPVRLYQGDYEKKEIVAESVLDTVRNFERDGAEYVHMVDLDGAKSGRKENAGLITAAAGILKIPVEAGGGIRAFEDIQYYIENGVSRVILGTAAVNDEELLKKALGRYGARIAVGMDCRDGYVRTAGWLQESSCYYLDFAGKMERLGVRTLIFTDISRDGTLQGPNLEMLGHLKTHSGCDIVASGGVHDLEDIRKLSDMDLYGAIIGKALYTGDISLKAAIETARRHI